LMITTILSNIWSISSIIWFSTIFSYNIYTSRVYSISTFFKLCYSSTTNCITLFITLDVTIGWPTFAVNLSIFTIVSLVVSLVSPYWHNDTSTITLLKVNNDDPLFFFFFFNIMALTSIWFSPSTCRVYSLLQNFFTPYVTTLALGSQPRQGHGKVQAGSAT
jgi:hypothetical protein